MSGFGLEENHVDHQDYGLLDGADQKESSVNKTAIYSVVSVGGALFRCSFLPFFPLLHFTWQIETLDF
jgi:hypothetical protein